MCDAVAQAVRAPALDRATVCRHPVAQPGEFVATLLGCMRAGVVPVPVNVRTTADAIEFILKDAGAKICLRACAAQTLSGRAARVEYGGRRTAQSYANFIEPGSFTAFEPAPDSIAVQQYTPGPPAVQKACCLHTTGKTGAAILAWSRRTTPGRCNFVRRPAVPQERAQRDQAGLTAGARVPLLASVPNAERYIDASALSLHRDLRRARR